MHQLWNRNFSWILLILSAMLLFSLGNSKECDQEEFTKCAEPLDMLHLTSNFSIGPARKEDLDKLCHELRKGVRCIQSYTRRCMDLQHRNHFNKLYHGTNQFIRDLCNDGEFQEEFLKYAYCSGMAKKELEVCNNHYKETMVFLKSSQNQENSENGTLNENIKTICCSMNEFADCSETAARKICGYEASKFTRKLYDKNFHSLTQIYCGNFTRNPGICRDGEGNSSNRVDRSSFGLLLTGTLLALLVSRVNR
ncbi:uncharacterized protein LOC108096896 [Drosophila ficusphila]|uniref:uncharacterized protein LOC108096896 n=1 Tax=Drosophila ficusphila TaxID=30025 RepID=UPI0007E680E7|nr:uncharacterized protein LOC108096896 [Drosophila ficusphila]XP_017054331.1 uncharacterized protein LOC108096896 [Drosophila ficusphila]XP_017054332.1 uncharacterized protein LOC108096896 [Drosophila ficusphila]